MPDWVEAAEFGACALERSGEVLSPELAKAAESVGLSTADLLKPVSGWADRVGTAEIGYDKVVEEAAKLREALTSKPDFLANGFTAAPGSTWTKAGRDYVLYNGECAVGQNNRLSAMGGIVHAMGDSSVQLRNSAHAVLSENASAEAFDRSLVRFEIDRYGPYRVTLHDSSLYVDTNGSHSQAFKNLLDLRAQLREPGKIPINTSTISRPFLNSPVLYEFDSLFARRVKELSAATVRIEKINADNGEAFLNGNGVALSDRLIGTAGHVVPANYQRGVRVQTAAGLMHDVEVLARDDANDATILKAKEAIPDVRPVMLAEPGEVKIGAPVVMVGTPGTQAAVHAYPGRLLAVDKVSNLEGSVEKMLTDATGGPGTSGSPIMDLRTGRVFAFVNGGHSFSQIKDPYAGFRPPALTGFSSDAFRRLIERIGDGTLSLR